MAESLWEPDGTQPPTPLSAFNDPVSGLVTGAGYGSEPFKIDLVKPVEPDMDEVRRQVDAMLSVEDEAMAPIVPAQRSKPPQRPTVTPGPVPNPRAGRPRSPGVRQLAGLRPRLPGGSPAARAPRPAGRRRPQGSTVRLAGVIAMLLLFVVLALTALSSFVDTINALFN